MVFTSTSDRLGRRGWQWAAIVLGLLATATMSVASAAVGSLPYNRPEQWWFELPAWLSKGAGASAMVTVFYVGLTVFALCWLVLGAGVRARRWRIRGLLLVAGLWALPFLFSPVALSTDLYTYLGQGFVAHVGLDPYEHGPASAGLPSELSHRMASAWFWTPSPYGPLFMAVDRGIAPLAVDHLVRAVIALRLVDVFGMGLMACSLPYLARSLGADPVRAVWIGATSPLIIGSFVLSGHNDALMIGLLVAGLTLAVRWHPLAGMVLCALAAMVKAPAAAGLIFVALSWVRRQPTTRAKFAKLGMSLGVVAVVVVLTAVITQLGWGWLNPATTAPGDATTPSTPATAIAKSVNSVLQQLGMGLPFAGLLSATRTVGMFVAGVIVLALLWRQPRLGLTRALGLAMLTVAILSPVTWPWYLTWGVVILAASMPTQRSPWLVALAACALFPILPDGSPVGIQSAVPSMATLYVVVAVYAAYWCYHYLVLPRPATYPIG